MLEINITDLLNNSDFDPWVLRNSVANLGTNAAQITWNNAKNLSNSFPKLNEEQLQNLRDYFRGYGAWDAEEIAAWSEQELYALCIQEIASSFSIIEEYCEETYQDMGGSWQDWQHLDESDYEELSNRGAYRLTIGLDRETDTVRAWYLFSN